MREVCPCVWHPVVAFESLVSRQDLTAFQMESLNVGRIYLNETLMGSGVDTRRQSGRMGRTGRQKGPLDKGTGWWGPPLRPGGGREGGRSEESGLRAIGTEPAPGRGHHTELSSREKALGSKARPPQRGRGVGGGGETFSGKLPTGSQRLLTQGSVPT